MDFGIGFWELCLTALVALLVLGPDKLPHAARTAGLWIGKARRMMQAVRNEVERELRVDELRQNILKHNPVEELNTLARDTRSELNAFRQEAEDVASGTEPAPVDENANRDPITETPTKP